MFANAYKIVKHFTHPVIISRRFFDKTVECECGAFIVINDEGWIITVNHLFESFFVFQAHAQEISGYYEKVRSIQEDERLDAKRKRKKVGQIKVNPKWITNYSFWWGCDGVQLQDLKRIPEGDWAIGRLEPFDSKAISVYPVLKDPKDINPGTSLCKIGYPFYQVEATFNETTNTFGLAPNTLPLPRFPIEGIFTRNIIAEKSRDARYEIKFLETSSPGLRGQSGGPIFDSKGTVWAVQCRTVHFPLGFNPKIKKNGHEIEENQFLNAGIGVHPELLIAFLKDNNVKFMLSDY